MNGHLFYCGSNVSFLQGGLPNGWAGGCWPALTANGSLTGYLAYLASERTAYGVFQTQGEASDACALLERAGHPCTGTIRCTRE